ncbi:ATP dependent DNA ligase, central domain protein [Candidatus Magnetomorum sp. HK-1]|nr:ATP dependent DNA ligase, central domain protein [Candidatus Magnetomorum sp. HK-1]
MIIDIQKMQEINGYLKGRIDCLDESLRKLPFDYKKRLSQQFFSINANQIEQKITGNQFWVSKKIDGHLQIIIFEDDQALMVGRNGTVRMNLPCLKEIQKHLSQKNIRKAIIACELYAQRENARSRVYDVIAALSEKSSIDSLALAVFDILEMDDQVFRTLSYADVWQRITEIFPSDGIVHAVETRQAKSKKDIRQLFDEWVTEIGHEGLVVRGDMPFMYKVKPKYTFDGVVVGYTEGINDHKGKIKSLLVGFYRDNDIIQVVGKVGNNFSEEDREKLYAFYSQKHINSSYIETDNDGIAFRMVQPDTVVEVGCNDVMLENTYGKPLLNNLLKHKDDSYSRYTTLPGLRFIYPVFEGMREDKSPGTDDTGLLQLKDFIDLSATESQTIDLPKSEILMREVYQKKQKNKIMVQKFMIWKTNKEKIDPRYTAFVFFYTNFSSQRKDALQTDIRISNDHKQIIKISEAFIKKNVKKGWEKI